MGLVSMNVASILCTPACRVQNLLVKETGIVSAGLVHFSFSWKLLAHLLMRHKLSVGKERHRKKMYNLDYLFESFDSTTPSCVILKVM